MSASNVTYEEDENFYVEAAEPIQLPKPKRHFSEAAKLKLSLQRRGSLNPNWKGDEAKPRSGDDRAKTLFRICVDAKLNGIRLSNSFLFCIFLIRNCKDDDRLSEEDS